MSGGVDGDGHQHRSRFRGVVCVDSRRDDRRTCVVGRESLIPELIADRVVVTRDEAAVFVVRFERPPLRRSDVEEREGKAQDEREERGGGRDLTQYSFLKLCCHVITLGSPQDRVNETRQRT